MSIMAADWILNVRFPESGLQIYNIYKRHSKWQSALAPLSNEILKFDEYQKDSSTIQAFPNTKPLIKQEPTLTVDPHSPKCFDNSEAADYAFAETASLMRILNVSSDRRVSRYWTAFQLQILWAYPIHPVAILLSGPHAFQFLWFATTFLTCSILSAILSLIFKLKNKQAAAEMFLFIAGAIVVTYAGAQSLCSRPTK
ncbi:hypothetical protein CVT25_004515 [Psilocybe cyanescens]|uniref:Uncharacterized protein n=1 Tax=Psilocybe cyanescens TaxID=93625 RepID=A0A409XRK1_PSICY|nr:hypothetical protein CVT25_004515 [Psilocybe cyanescens]